MAQKTVVTLTDDIDGGEADETVHFELDGAQYEIDLSEQNAQALREALQPWVQHARKIRGSKIAPPRPRSSTERKITMSDRQAIQKFARDNDFPPVADRGRVPGEIERMWREAGCPA